MTATGDTPLVCILSDSDGPRLAAAIQSAQSFDLTVLVGACANKPGGVAAVDIDWQDDFAAARNQLADIALEQYADHPYLLWLDSDEELISWPAHDWGAETAPWFSLQIEDTEALTPRPTTRLQRNNGSLRWHHAIHEMLYSVTPPQAPTAEPLGGALLRHHGYADDQTIAAKLRRNQAIVAAERRCGFDYLYLWVEEARFAEAFGKGATMAWTKVFNHPEAAPRHPGAIDLRVEAAESLCAFGNTAPALQLLAENPRILGLQLAVLGAEQRESGEVDAARLDFLSHCARAGPGDWRYSYPRALLGASREEILALVKEVADENDQSATSDKIKRSDGEQKMTGRFTQSDDFDAETLGNDLVLMNNKTREVLTLNPTARAVWDLLEGGLSRDEIGEAFGQAFPDIDSVILGKDINRTLEHLLASGLISRDGDAA
ncbi:MAG: PqqD family peptide modification chaperone [Rhodospirillaceae bacterium]|nr:PqqD family peptide modification chaperone [Rhodospirillaceae bacterium]